MTSPDQNESNLQGRDSKSTPGGRLVRAAFSVIAVIVAGVVLLWAADKLVVYYLARSYIEEIAQAFDLNKHLANALLIASFVVAALFATFLTSFSKRKRYAGFFGLAALLIVHSIALWYATRHAYFDRAGNPAKCYVLTRDGKVTYGEQPGVDPATGRVCRALTAEMLERLQQYEIGKRPQRITASNPVFFDPRSGEPIAWYARSKDGEIELFDLMGFHPDTGEELLPLTKEVAATWKIQEEKRARRAPKLISNPDTFVFFDSLSGVSRAWFWTSADGRYEFYDAPGFQPQTGDKLEIVTRDVVNDWKAKQVNPTTPSRAPNRLQLSGDTVFFDPVNGTPRLWFWRKDKGDYEFFDGPGFHPQNGQSLQSFTRELLTQYQQEIEERAAKLKAEQARLEAEQKSKQLEDERRLAQQKQQQEADERKRADQLKAISESSRRCDELAANPSDKNRVAEGVQYGVMKVNAAAAFEACTLAVQQNPAELRFQYQLGRALELLGDGPVRQTNRQKAFEIHQTLVRRGYPAAFDNLGSIYRWDKKDLTTAASLFRKGAELGDSDSMLSLADMIEHNTTVPQGPGETPIELYRHAAELGNPNGLRAYNVELSKIQQAEQQQTQQLEQQRVMLQLMGNVLRNVPYGR